MYRLLQTYDCANFLWKFRLLVRLCPLHSPSRCVHRIWNYEGWNLWPNFVTEFVDPVENKGYSHLFKYCLEHWVYTILYDILIKHCSNFLNSFYNLNSFVNFSLIKLIFNSHQIFSIGFKSGDLAGHSILSILFFK